MAACADDGRSAARGFFHGPAEQPTAAHCVARHEGTPRAKPRGVGSGETLGVQFRFGENVVHHQKGSNVSLAMVKCSGTAESTSGPSRG
jgi:hypothetical protein